MPCDTKLSVGQTLAQRMAEVQAALKRLETALSRGIARVVVGANGAIRFEGWGAEERRGVSDVCAYRTLASENSWALRQAVARAEAQGGTRVNPQAIAAGWHTHDGGKTWGHH